jgi:integrase
LRVGDILTLQWKDISWERKEIIRRCLKNGKQVILPVQGDFLIALEREYQTRSPRDEEPVLLDPETGQAFEYEDYRKFLMQLGVRAGVIHVHPHRFRPTFAIDMLLKLGDVYDVARLLADTVAVVERHYLPYVEALRMRARVRMIDGHGLEEFSIKKRADQNEPTGSEEPAGIPAKALP